MTEADCGHKELDACQSSLWLQRLEVFLCCYFCPFQMATSQDADWCLSRGWLQKHGIGSIDGNKYFVVTSAFACSETSARKAWHRGGGQTPGQPLLPWCWKLGYDWRQLDWGGHLKSVCMHQSALKYKTAFRTFQNWSCTSRSSESVPNHIVLMKYVHSRGCLVLVSSLVRFRQHQLTLFRATPGCWEHTTLD